MICRVQMQPKKHTFALDDAEFTLPLRQHEVDQTDQEYIRRARSRYIMGGSMICAVCISLSLP